MMNKENKEKLCEEAINASKAGDIKTVKKLINEGADNYDWIMYYALLNNHKEIYLYCIENFDIGNDFIVYGAIKAGNLEILKRYINNASNNAEKNAERAAKSGKLNILEYFFNEYNIDANLILKDILTEDINMDILRYLCSKNVDIDYLIKYAKKIESSMINLDKGDFESIDPDLKLDISMMEEDDLINIQKNIESIKTLISA